VSASYRILVTGSRVWDDWRTIVLALTDAAGGHARPVVIQGAARGADFLAAQAAADLGWDVESWPADWDRHGKAAGFVRNRYMVELGADVCLAFIRDRSRGATHCAELAERAGIPVKRYTREEMHG
jgi:YspA, cpYpsA-related SLOG family